MKVVARFAVIVFLLSGANAVFAYEPGTHLQLSKQAARQSVLGESNGILADLGLKPLGDTTQNLPDPQAGETIALGPDSTNPFTARDADTILNLIGTGAALEDEGFRALCHFYDPLPGHAAPLSVLGITASYSAPEWATGHTDSGAPVDGDCQFGPVASSPQLYSLKDAGDYFYKAL